MMGPVIDGMVQLLSAAPDPLLAAARMGDRLPSTPSDVPAIAMSLTVEGSRGNGLGSYRREGHQLTQNTSVMQVQAGPDTFSADLRTLQLPLPLRNPDDVQIIRVTGPNQPVSYRLVSSPAAVEEFRVDSLCGQVIFGSGQPAGEKLQVTSWTMLFRDDIRGERSNGTITLDVWGGSAVEVSTLARKLETKLADPTGPRQWGFGILQSAGLTAVQNAVYQPAVGSSFPVWRQQLSYTFHFDLEQVGAASSGGPIRKINLNLEKPQEAFSLPAGS
jgi:hypothetical protein